MRTRTKSFPTIREVTEIFIKDLLQQTDMTVDLQPLFFRLTMDTTLAVLFGRSLHGSLNPARLAKVEDFSYAFNNAQHWLAQRSRIGEIYWIMDGLDFRRSCRKVHRFVEKIVSAALKERNDSLALPASEDRYVFLKALIDHTQDSKILRDQCIHVLLAGRDTTACLLSWTL